jgi:hypothetical protein
MSRSGTWTRGARARALPRPRPISQGKYARIIPDWHDDAACKPWVGIFTSDRKLGVENLAIAQGVCESCPVLDECREWGHKYEVLHFLAGYTPQEWKHIKKRIKNEQDALLLSGDGSGMVDNPDSFGIDVPVRDSGG